MPNTAGPSASSPTAWRRWLIFELRRMRNEAGLSQQEVGKAFGWSAARVSLLEVAGQNPSADDLEKLLPLYGLPAEQWPVYFDAAARSAEKGWWERYDQREVPSWLSLYVGLEQGASVLQVYEPAMIHGLLQTSAYAADVLRRDLVPRTKGQVDRMVELRTTRQEALTREENPLELAVVMDEAALRRRPDGGEVMAAQLEHLAEMAQRPNITVQVLPLDAWAMSYASSGFRLLGFPWPSDPGVVYIEYRSGAIYLEDQQEIDAHAVVFQRLTETAALSPDRSLDMIRDIARETERG